MLDELGRHATSRLHTIGKGVTSNGSGSCTVQNLHLLDCVLYCSNIFHCFIRIDGPVLLAVEELWIMDCTLGIQVEPPSGASRACSSAHC